MKWSAYKTGNFFFTKLRRAAIILASKSKILGREMYMQLRPLLKRLLVNLGSVLKSAGAKIAKQLASLVQRQTVTSDRKNTSTASDRSIGFKQLLRRFGIFATAKLGETIQGTTQAIKHDMEVNKKNINESSEQIMPAEIITRRSNLNEILAQQLREQMGIDCEAPEVGSLQIEHTRYYSNNFAMSPKITTDRGCIIVRGRIFNLIQIIQRN